MYVNGNLFFFPDGSWVFKSFAGFDIFGVKKDAGETATKGVSDSVTRCKRATKRTFVV